MATPLPPMSAPAALAAAYAQRNAAHAVLTNAYGTSREATARATANAADQAANAARVVADSLAQSALLATLTYHQIVSPPADTFGDLLSAMHEGTFATLAQLLDSDLNYPNGVLLGLRRAWRQHHGRWTDGPRIMDHEASICILRCTTFGEVAFVLEDEHQVADEVFEITRVLWRALRGMEGVPPADPNAPGPDDPLSPPPSYPTSAPVAGPSSLPIVHHSPLPGYLVDPGHTLVAPTPSLLSPQDSPTHQFSNDTSETGSNTSGGSDAANDPRPRLIIRIPLNATQAITDWEVTDSETGSTTTGATDSTAEWDNDEDYLYEPAGGEDEDE